MNSSKPNPIEDSVAPLGRVTAPATGQKRAVIADSATGGYVTAPQPPSSVPRSAPPTATPPGRLLDDGAVTGVNSPPSAADTKGRMALLAEGSPKTGGQKVHEARLSGALPTRWLSETYPQK